MGPYRSATIGYSRRELIADAILHINSITIGCIGLAVLAWRIANDDRLNPLAPGLYLYSVSLVTMFCCSALFNMRVGFVRHSPEKVRFIQLCDHSGIILLIAGIHALHAALLLPAHTSLCLVCRLCLLVRQSDQIKV